MPGPSDRMGCDPRNSDTPRGGTRVRLGLVSVWGLRGVRGWLVWCPFASDAVFLNPHPNPTGSIHATSVAASRVEQALSEVASSLQSSAPKQGPLHPWMTLAQIWLHAGTALPPAPPRLPLRPRGACARAGSVHAGARPLPPRPPLPGTRSALSRTRSSGGPASALSLRFPLCAAGFTAPSPGVMSLRFLLHRGVHRALSWGDEPPFPSPPRPLLG